uniref:Uncharacterized protein n=1 Tax=Oreochromis aureus TaxID=47969 RepID=A0A668SKN5_OREAU
MCENICEPICVCVSLPPLQRAPSTLCCWRGEITERTYRTGAFQHSTEMFTLKLCCHPAITFPLVQGHSMTSTPPSQPWAGVRMERSRLSKSSLKPEALLRLMRE